MPSKQKKHIADLIAKFEAAARTGVAALLDGAGSPPAGRGMSRPGREPGSPNKKVFRDATRVMGMCGHASNPARENATVGGSMGARPYGEEMHGGMHAVDLNVSSARGIPRGASPGMPKECNDHLSEAAEILGGDQTLCKCADFLLAQEPPADGTSTYSSGTRAEAEGAGPSIAGYDGAARSEPCGAADGHASCGASQPDSGVVYAMDSKEQPFTSTKTRRVSFDPVPRIYEISQEDSPGDSLSDSGLG